MAALDGIKGIGKASLQLLEAAGIRDAEHLAAQDTDALVAELERANDVFAICKRPPAKTTVVKWISGAKELAGTSPEQESDEEPIAEHAAAESVGHGASPEIAEMLSLAPFAISLPGTIILERGLAISDIPAGLLVSRHSGDAVIRVDPPKEPRTGFPQRRASGNPETMEKKPDSRHFDVSMAKPMASSPVHGKRLPKSKPEETQDRVSLIRAPLERTNRGKDPQSRNYIRGVLHTHPWSIRIGAIFSLLLLVNLPIAIVAAFLFFVSREYPDTFEWVPEWLIALPAALPFTALAYLIWGFPGRCRICSQKLFVHKGAHKHANSHRLPGMGYVAPLCIHLLLFSWFRCSSCGTPVRLKK